MSMPARDSVYEIYQQHFNSRDKAVKALNSQKKTLKRICAAYPSVVYAMGLSEYNGKRTKKINVNAGKRGRPKYEFVPKSKRYEDSYKTGLHLHTFIGGLYAATVATKFTDVQNKVYHNKPHERYVEKSAVTARRRKNGFFPLEYIEKQCSNMRYSCKEAVQEYAEKSKQKQREYYLKKQRQKNFDPFEVELESV